MQKNCEKMSPQKRTVLQLEPDFNVVGGALPVAGSVFSMFKNWVKFFWRHMNCAAQGERRSVTETRAFLRLPYDPINYFLLRKHNRFTCFEVVGTSGNKWFL